jgi:probable rRNA maturation factor
MPVLVTRKAPGSPKLGSLVVGRLARKMLDHLGLAKFELSVLLCDDVFIEKLNREHRKKNKPTDVLAFPLYDRDPDRNLPGALGDIVISLDTAFRQAKERRQSLLREVTFLLAHGLLHLIGYDHQTKKEERVMNAKSDELLLLVTAAVPLNARAAPRNRVKRSPRGAKK